MNKMKHIFEYMIYLLIFVVLSKLSLTLFQKIIVETTMDIRESNILGVVFVLFYLCFVLPCILLIISKLKESGIIKTLK